MPVRRCSALSSARICLRSFGSSAASGSSSSSSWGSSTSERARATRCFSPPESWAGKTVAFGAQFHQLESAPSACLAILTRRSRSPNSTLPQRRQMRKQRIVLKDGADIALPRLQAVHHRRHPAAPHPKSGFRSRRSCAAWWFCRSRRVPAANRIRRAPASSETPSTARCPGKSFTTAAQFQNRLHLLPTYYEHARERMRGIWRDMLTRDESHFPGRGRPGHRLDARIRSGGRRYLLDCGMFQGTA